MDSVGRSGWRDAHSGQTGARLRRASAAAAIAVCACGLPLVAAELESRTSKAYDEYVERARKAFLARVAEQKPALPEAAVITGRPGGEDGIIEVPGGLVHHWVGTAFLEGVTLQQVLAVSQDYPNYSNVHEPIIASRVLARDGDVFRVQMRLREGEAGITAVLDVRSTVRYVRPDSRTTYGISTSEEIRQVENAGEPDERILPAGRDSGYLWRANTFSRFVQLDGGVYVEMETFGLSRRFPPLLGWVIEPIARRIGRKSVEASLREFSHAVASRR